MSCKTDWRWEGKCSSPGGCCKGGRKRRTRRRRRQKRGRGKKHKSSPTSRDKYSGPERRTLKKTKRPPSDGGNGLKIIEKYKRKPVVAGNPTTTTRVGRPSSGRTVSTESGTSVNTTRSAPRTMGEVRAIIEAGGPDQTDDEYRQRIAALLAADGGTAPRIVADESYPDLFDYHQATVGGELGGAFGGPRTSPVTFSEVLMEPELRKWEERVRREAQQKEAKKQWKKALNLGPVQPEKSPVRREQYGGRKRKTRRRKRRGGEFANNVRGHNVSTFNRALAEKEWGPAKEPIKRDMITPERKKRYDQHIAKLKPKEWWNPGTWFGGGRRRTRKQRGGKIEKLTATDMMRNSTTILGHKINEIIDDVNQHHQSAGTGGTGGMRKTRRNRRRRRKKRRKRRRSRRGGLGDENVEAAEKAAEDRDAKRKEKEIRKEAYEKAAAAAAAAAAATPSNSAGNHARAAQEDKSRRIETLVEMGISKHDADAAVKRTSTIEGAIEWLGRD